MIGIRYNGTHGKVIMKLFWNNRKEYKRNNGYYKRIFGGILETKNKVSTDFEWNSENLNGVDCWHFGETLWYSKTQKMRSWDKILLTNK